MKEKKTEQKGIGREGWFDKKKTTTKKQTQKVSTARRNGSGEWGNGPVCACVKMMTVKRRATVFDGKTATIGRGAPVGGGEEGKTRKPRPVTRAQRTVTVPQPEDARERGKTFFVRAATWSSSSFPLETCYAYIIYIVFLLLSSKKTVGEQAFFYFPVSSFSRFDTDTSFGRRAAIRGWGR